MTPFQKRVTIFLIGGVGLAALVGVWSLRRPLIDAAQADLQARNIHWFQIMGTRIPCSGKFDVGVTVIFKTSDQGELIGGRLCRPPDWSSAWRWFPDPGKARPGVPAR